MRQPHLQIGEQRQVGTGPGDLLEVQISQDQRLFEDRGFGDELPPGRSHDGAAGEGLPAFETHELGQGDEDAVLARDVLRDATPTARDSRVRGAPRPAGATAGAPRRLRLP